MKNNIVTAFLNPILTTFLPTFSHLKNEKLKILWLLTLIALTATTIALGAYTRLSGSGLSMVEWRLIQGILPPLTHQQWLESFALYQQFPEYQWKNTHIKLGDYQFIYLVEYSHRLLGRLIGLLSIVPFFLFLWAKMLNKKEIMHGLFLIFLVATQGAMGWYMVKSGLVDVPQVSHYRLTVHFFLALLYITYMSMLLLHYAGAFRSFGKNLASDFGANDESRASAKASFASVSSPNTSPTPTPSASWPWGVILFFLITQSVLGTFTAGLDGGLVSKDYPKMFGQWIPWAQIFPQNNNLEVSFWHNFWRNFLENPSTIQFFHRHLGVLLTLMLSFFCLKKLIKKDNSSDKWVYKLTLGISVLLPVLGIATVMTQVNFFLAIFHQLTVVVLFQCVVFLWISHKISRKISRKIGHK